MALSENGFDSWITTREFTEATRVLQPIKEAGLALGTALDIRGNLKEGEEATGKPRVLESYSFSVPQYVLENQDKVETWELRRIVDLFRVLGGSDYKDVKVTVGELEQDDLEPSSTQQRYLRTDIRLGKTGAILADVLPNCTHIIMDSGVNPTEVDRYETILNENPVISAELSAEIARFVTLPPVIKAGTLDDKPRFEPWPVFPSATLSV